MSDAPDQAELLTRLRGIGEDPSAAGALDISAAAGTLHEIARLVRDEEPDAPRIWAAYVYAGC